MPKCKVKVAHVYGGVRREVGELLDVEARHVPLMLALGRIDVPQDASACAQTEPTYQTRAMIAEPRARRVSSRKAA